MKTTKNNFKFENGAKVIATMINGDKLAGVITKRTYNHFNDRNYYTIEFETFYDLRDTDSMNGVPEDKIELA